MKVETFKVKVYLPVSRHYPAQPFCPVLVLAFAWQPFSSLHLRLVPFLGSSIVLQLQYWSSKFWKSTVLDSANRLVESVSFAILRCKSKSGSQGEGCCIIVGISIHPEIVLRHWIVSLYKKVFPEWVEVERSIELQGGVLMTLIIPNQDKVKRLLLLQLDSQVPEEEQIWIQVTISKQELLYHDVFSTYMHHFVQDGLHPLKYVIRDIMKPSSSLPKRCTICSLAQLNSMVSSWTTNGKATTVASLLVFEDNVGEDGLSSQSTHKVNIDDPYYSFHCS